MYNQYGKVCSKAVQEEFQTVIVQTIKYIVQVLHCQRSVESPWPDIQDLRFNEWHLY